MVDGPGRPAQAATGPPIKVMEEFKPVKIIQPRPGIRSSTSGELRRPEIHVRKVRPARP